MCGVKKQIIDNGAAFDWGKASGDYARYRDIYPQEFYDHLLKKGLCTAGQRVLDIGTGTGVLPRNLYPYGAVFTGLDASPQQIGQARRLALAGGMDIDFVCLPAEEAPFPPASFDVVTACQCFVYFDHAVLAPRVAELLKPGGRFAVLYMAWLPEEDAIARRSEELMLRYSPQWTGGGETRHPIAVPPVYDAFFAVESSDVFDLRVPFTRETWNGRIKACRAVGASLPPEQAARFEQEHKAMLEEIAPQAFAVLHYAAVTILRRKDA